MFVTDGFTGNMTLKLLEGDVGELLDALREEITATTRGKLGGLLIRPAARRLRTRLDPDTYGGAYLLGLRGLAVIAHGNSGRDGDRERDPPRRPGRRARVVERLAERLPGAAHDARRATASSPRRALSAQRQPCMIGALLPSPTTNEVTWQRRVKRSSSASRKS